MLRRVIASVLAILITTCTGLAHQPTSVCSPPAARTPALSRADSTLLQPVARSLGWAALPTDLLLRGEFAPGSNWDLRKTPKLPFLLGSIDAHIKSARDHYGLRCRVHVASPVRQYLDPLLEALKRHSDDLAGFVGFPGPQFTDAPFGCAPVGCGDTRALQAKLQILQDLLGRASAPVRLPARNVGVFR